MNPDQQPYFHKLGPLVSLWKKFHDPGLWTMQKFVDTQV